jgi:hypothetical protein
VQPHGDDHDACDDRELARIKPDQRADGARARAECHEHGGEAGDEQQRGDDGIALDAGRRLLVGEPLKRGASQIDEIGRHQRQHARREEAHDPGKQRGEDGDVGGHGP